MTTAQTTGILHTDPDTGVVQELTTEEAAELAADLVVMVETAADTMKRGKLELEALRGKLADALGEANPCALSDGRRVVFAAPKPRARRIHPGACETHRDALLRLGVVKATTETVTTYSVPTVTDVEAAAPRLSAEGITLRDLLVPEPTEVKLEMHVIHPEPQEGE